VKVRELSLNFFNTVSVTLSLLKVMEYNKYKSQSRRTKFVRILVTE